MTQITMLITIPEEKVDDYLAFTTQLTGDEPDIDRHIASVCDLDPDRYSQTVLYGHELPDLAAAINRHLADFGETDKLPEDTSALSPGQKQRVLDLAGSFSWHKGSVDDGLSIDWPEQFRKLQL